MHPQFDREVVTGASRSLDVRSRLGYDFLEMITPAGLAVRAFLLLALAPPFLLRSRPSGPSEPAKRAEALLAGRVSEREPGAAILVVKDGAVAYKGSRGVTDLRTGRPIDTRTNFRLASLSKSFTAAAVMLLVRDGKLRYEDRLTDSFPEFPEYGRAITICNLLDHTSGLPDYEELMSPADLSVPVDEAQIKDDSVLDLLKGQKAGKFPAGARWAYSNSGYVVLGLVVGRVSGLPFADFLRERIFVPLKMMNTVAYVRGKNNVPNRAYGHSRVDGRWRETDQSPTSATLGDGGVYSSLSDLRLWDEALRKHTLLTEEEMRPALTPVRVPEGGPEEPDGKAADYGFGWFLNPWRGHARMWHYGETMGFRNAIERFTDDGMTIVVLSNRSDFEAATLALEAAGAFLNKEKTKTPPANPRPQPR
jgi:CubicO group peptidase (beta-lactamase class C family)